MMIVGFAYDASVTKHSSDTSRFFKGNNKEVPFLTQIQPLPEKKNIIL